MCPAPQGLRTACATLFALLACSYAGTCKGILKTKFQSALSVLGRRSGISCPAVGEKGRQFCGPLVPTWTCLRWNCGLTHAVGVKARTLHVSSVGTGAARFSALHVVMRTSSTSTALLRCVAFGLGRLPSRTLQAALWILWACKGTHAVTWRSHDDPQGHKKESCLGSRASHRGESQESALSVSGAHAAKNWHV